MANICCARSIPEPAEKAGLPQVTHLHIVRHGVSIASELAGRTPYQMQSIGGEVYQNALSTVGPVALEQIAALSGAAGLHAQPAAAFVDIAKHFQSEVRVRHVSKVANGKSLVSLLKLGVEEVRRELDAEPVDIGIMVDVPSAVLMAPELAAHADFFSIGSNDLTQYALAMDRLHPSLARQADALHPAVLRMIEMTVKAASAAGKWVGVCGVCATAPTIS